MESKKTLVLGVKGMLGHAMFHVLSGKKDLDVYGTVRNDAELDDVKRVFDEPLTEKIESGIEADDFDRIEGLLKSINPDFIVNCIGLIKQAPSGKEPLPNIVLNALFPHKIAHLCERLGSRMIHISTDCVFDGQKGNYTEQDPSDATDYYGRTKLLGEVLYPHCVTLRTSIIGHELTTNLALVDWFLSQKEDVNGFTRAIYSGLPTVELARVIHEFVMTNSALTGLYHVSSDPISKYELLKLVAGQYEMDLKIKPVDEFFCDRSLDSSYFRKEAGYTPPPWPELVKRMHEHYVSSGLYIR